MKVLIAEPRVSNPVRFSRGGRRSETGVRLSSIYLAGYARQHVEGIEFTIQENRLRSDNNADFSIEDEIRGYDVVAVGCVTSEFPDAYRILKQAKEMGKITIIGGLFPTGNPELVISSGVVDFVVRNEGELTFSSLLAALKSGKDTMALKGISYLDPSKGVVHNPDQCLIADLDQIKPAYDLVSLKEYAFFERGPIYTARGCPHNCSFCSIPRHWHQKYRETSIDNILENIAAYEQAGFAGINFKDEAITNNPERAAKLFLELSEHGNGSMRYKLKSRVDGIDESLLELMASAGVDAVQIGVESTSDEKLALMNKGINFEMIQRQVDMILSKGVGLNLIFIIGYEGQTPEELRRDMEYACLIGRQPNVTTYLTFNTPHPGTNLWLQAPGNGLRILSTNLNNYNHKRIVATPKSLGEPMRAIFLMRDAYMQTRGEIGMEKHNPELDLEYLFQENPSLSHKKNIIY